MRVTPSQKFGILRGVVAHVAHTRTSRHTGAHHERGRALILAPLLLLGVSVALLSVRPEFAERVLQQGLIFLLQTPFALPVLAAIPLVLAVGIAVHVLPDLLGKPAEMPDRQGAASPGLSAQS